jgi:Zn-dependent protease with chaperone function
VTGDVALSVRSPRQDATASSLPSTSAIRFTLLIVLVVVTSAAAGLYLSLLNRSGAAVVQAAIPCLADAGVLNGGSGGPGPAWGSEPTLRCYAGMFVTGLSGMCIVAAAVVLAGYLLHLVLPWWRIRRHHLVRVPADAQALSAYLSSTASDVGLLRAPDFWIAPYNRIPAGLAFGRWGRPMIQINAGLVPLFLTDQATFRAILLHELAHVRNRDIGRTYFTVAVWRAFLLVALAPFVLLNIFPNLIIGPDHWQLTDVGNELLRSTKIQGVIAVAVLTALIYLTRAAVLRSRENLADATAAAHGGHALVAILGSAQGQRRSAGRLTALIRSHPTPAQRLRYLEERSQRYRFNLAEVFAVGVAASSICTSVMFVLEFAAKTPMLLPHLDLISVYLPLFIALLYSALIALYLSVIYWRVAASNADGDIRIPTTVAAAAAMTVGILLGEPLSIAGALGGLRLGVFGSAIVKADAASGTVSALLLFVGVLLLVRWTRDGAALQLARSQRRATGTAYIGTAAVGGLAFLSGFWIWYLFHGSTASAHVELWTQQLAQSHGQLYAPLPGIALINAQYQPLEYVAFVPFATTLLALPWISTALTSIRGSRSDMPGRPLGAGTPRIPIGRALIVGLCGGALYVAAATVVVWLAAPSIEQMRQRYGDGIGRYVLNSYIHAATLTGALVAVVVVSMTPRLGITLSLAASFASGTVATASMPVTYTLGRCARTVAAERVLPCLGKAPVSIYPYLFNQIIVRGALAAMAVGLVCTAVIGVLRKALAPRLAVGRLATPSTDRENALSSRTRIAITSFTALLFGLALTVTVINTADFISG